MRKSLLAIGLIALAAPVAFIATIGGDSADAGPQPPRIVSVVGERPAQSTAGKLACTAADERANFRLYSLGKQFDGLSLTAVLRHCTNPMPVPAGGSGLPSEWRTNSVSYVYGDCQVEIPEGAEHADGGCAPPLEVQVWPACERHVALYEPDARPTITQRRGVATARFGDSRIEVYTADSTVVIFAADRALAARATEALQPVRPGAPPAQTPPPIDNVDELPPPAMGSLTGDLRCA